MKASDLSEPLRRFLSLIALGALVVTGIALFDEPIQHLVEVDHVQTTVDPARYGTGLKD